MPAEQLIAVVQGVLLIGLTIKAGWGWVFGREHAEENLKYRVAQLEKRLAELAEDCTQNDRAIVQIRQKLNNRR